MDGKEGLGNLPKLKRGLGAPQQAIRITNRKLAKRQKNSIHEQKLKAHRWGLLKKTSLYKKRRFLKLDRLRIN